MGKNYRRIEQLKAIAFDCGFSNEDAKQFGKLSKTATGTQTKNQRGSG